MSIWGDFDPTGNNFMGLGPKLGRIMAGVNSAGGSEFHRTDGFGTQPGSWENHLNRGLGGAGPGAVGGFVTGGVPGAIVGGVGGGVAAGTGKTNSTTLSGFGENLGIGAGAGGLAGYGAGTGLFSGGGSLGGGAGAGTMGAYSPTSTPVMGQAGSTLGGGMGSSMNLAPSAMGSTGAASGAPVAGSSPSMVSKILQMQRMMPQGGGQQAPAASQANVLAKLYQMFPGLRPGAQIGQSPNIGGM